MKKQNDIKATIIEDISAAGEELSDEHLRLVSGGKRKRKYPVRSWCKDATGKRFVCDAIA